MSEPRKCTYTNSDANTRDTVIPKDRSPNLLHNWVNRTPTSSEYLKNKQNRMPTELEMEANRIFYLLELARLDVVFFEDRLKEVQAKIADVKKEQIDQSYHIKDLAEGLDSQAEQIIEKVETKSNKKIWD